MIAWRWLVFTFDSLLDLVWDRRPASQVAYENAIDGAWAKWHTNTSPAPAAAAPSRDSIGSVDPTMSGGCVRSGSKGEPTMGSCKGGKKGGKGK